MPSRITSAMPPTSVATMGRPSASASISATGNPSHCEASVKMSHAPITRTASSRNPVRITFSVKIHRIAEFAGLGFLRSLTDGDEPHRHLTVGEQPAACNRFG